MNYAKISLISPNLTSTVFERIERRNVQRSIQMTKPRQKLISLYSIHPNWKPRRPSGTIKQAQQAHALR